MNKKDLGNRMAKIRLKTGESARSASFSLGKSGNYLTHAESGEILPPLDFLEEFCEYFGVPLAVLVDPNFKCPERYMLMSKELDTLSEEDFNNLLSIARSLNKK